MTFLQRLRDEPHFAGSRCAPAGCQIFTTPGAGTFTWPAGVSRAVVSVQGGSGGGASGANTRGGGGGGAAAFAERLVVKTDATATVLVGSNGAGGVGNNVAGADGTDSSFTQASSAEDVIAKAGHGGVGPSGGAGGLASASTGTIKFGGGDGGDTGSGDGGGGGGAAACLGGDGEDGQDDVDPDQGGEGGAACPGTGQDSGGGGRGGNEGMSGQNNATNFGGGGGGGTRLGSNTNGASGVGSYVIVCWEDPVPTGYCVDSQCKKWWGFGQPCGYYYGYSRQCFYYPRYFYGYPRYLYDYQGVNLGWPVNCCEGRVLPAQLTMTIISTGTFADGLPSQTFPIYAVDPISAYPGAIAFLNTSISPPIPAYMGHLSPGPSYADGSGFTPNMMGIVIAAAQNTLDDYPVDYDDRCVLAPGIDDAGGFGVTGLFGNAMEPLSCNPLYLHHRFGPSDGDGTDIIITES